MLGTIVNSIAIVLGCIAGLFIKGGISERVSSTIMKSLALCVLYIGVSGSLGADDPMIIIISMAIGALIGELIDIDKWLNRLGIYIEKKLKSKIKKKDRENEISIAEGFVTASLLFCVGAMAIVGSLESGLQGNHSTLFAKSIIDGISSIIFTASLGVGVILSSVSVFIYQGVITIGASFLSGVLSSTVITTMSSVGSLLIIGLGLNMLEATKIKVANLLPSVFIPIIFGLIGIL